MFDIGESCFVVIRKQIRVFKVLNRFCFDLDDGCVYELEPENPSYEGTRFMFHSPSFFHTMAEAESSLGSFTVRGVSNFNVGATLYYSTATGVRDFTIRKVEADTLGSVRLLRCDGTDGATVTFSPSQDDIFLSHDKAYQFTLKLKLMLASLRASSSFIGEHKCRFAVGDTLYHKEFSGVEPYQVLCVHPFAGGQACVYKCCDLDGDGLTLRFSFEGLGSTVEEADQARAWKKLRLDDPLYLYRSQTETYQPCRVVKVNACLGPTQYIVKALSGPELTGDVGNCLLLHANDTDICVNRAECEISKHVCKIFEHFNPHCPNFEHYLQEKNLVCFEDMHEPSPVHFADDDGVVSGDDETPRTLEEMERFVDEVKDRIHKKARRD